MDDITFMNDFIRKAKPQIPLRYGLLEEGRLLAELDRAEQLASTAHERKREETETKKLYEALEKEEHDALVVKKRNQQLMQNTDELRRLRSYVITAETTKDLVGQLKLQDEMIEQRFKEAQRQAQELRAEYSAAEERRKQLEEQKHLEAKRMREDLRGQMAVHDLQRAEELEEKIRDGKELTEKIRKLDESDRLKKEADAKAKLKLRQEILETLRQRREFFELQNANDVKAVHDQYNAQNKAHEYNEHIKHVRNQRFEQQHKIATMIGSKTVAAENAKRKAISDQIDMFVNERTAQEQLAEEREREKAIETRRMFQTQVAMHLEDKSAKKERQQQLYREIAFNRKPLTPEEQDRPSIRSHILDQIAKLEEFMAEKKEIDRERAEREAEERRQLYESYIKKAETHDRDVENAKRELLSNSSIGLLRYLPSSVVRTDYLPQPLRQQVREAVRKNPIPVLTKKRHQPHLRGRHGDETNLVRCSKICSNNHAISNIF